MIRDRLSWMRFLGFELGGATPDENTIRHFRNRLTETGTLKRVMKAFDWQLHKKGYIPMSGQIVDASLVPAPKQRNTEEEKAAASAEEAALEGINLLVNVELERQKWRGEMAMKAFEHHKHNNTKVDPNQLEQGIGQPLPPIQRDTAFKNGGWVASAAQQRRALALDGGTAVTKLRLTVKSAD